MFAEEQKRPFVFPIPNIPLRFLVLTVFLFAFLLGGEVAYATSDSSAEVWVPILRPNQAMRFEKHIFHYDHSYANLPATTMSSIFRPYCPELGQDCGVINPLASSGLKISVNHSVDGWTEDAMWCELKIDLGNLQVPSKDLHRVNLHRKKDYLDLLIKALERNYGSSQIQDCRISYKGLNEHKKLKKEKLHRWFNPQLFGCPGQLEGLPVKPNDSTQARELNRQGMALYKQQHYAEAEKVFRQAAKSNCGWVIPVRNLAAVLSLQGRPYASAAILWRAYRLDPGSTLEKIFSDKDYDNAKHVGAFIFRNTLVGHTYTSYCKKRFPAWTTSVLTDKQVHTTISQIHREGQTTCRLILAKPLPDNGMRLFKRPVSYPIFGDAPNSKVRATATIAIHDRSSLIGRVEQNGKLLAAEHACKESMFRAQWIRFRSTEWDPCALGVNFIMPVYPGRVPEPIPIDR